MPRSAMVAPGMRVRSKIGSRPAPITQAVARAADALVRTERTEPVAGLTEGRTVHYVGSAPRHYAGIVIHVLDPVSGLALVSVYRKDTGEPVAVRSYYDPTGRTQETWHWLEECE